LKSKGELHGVLSGLSDCFGRFFPWLADRYDPASGGFFYAASSPRLAKTPDIESTAQALNILERAGLLGGMPEPMRRRLVSFFQRKQDSDTGYFYDEDPAMRQDDVMVARALGYSRNALGKLGGAPLYPLPAEAAPPYTQSPEAYARWLRSVPLSNGWRGCDRLCGSQAYLKLLPEPARSEFVRVALHFFEEIQDPATGLWGEGRPYVRLSGAFKLLTFYRAFGSPMPRGNALYRSVLRCLRTERADDMCYVRNPLELLDALRPAMTASELSDVVRISAANVGGLLQPDGGFSRERGHSPPAPNVAQVKAGETYPELPEPVRLGLGEREGDMNAGTQAVWIRLLLHRLTDEPGPDWSALTATFYGRIAARIATTELR